MNRSISSIIAGFVLVLGALTSTANADPIGVNAGFIAQFAASSGGNPLNTAGTALTGMCGNTEITGTNTLPNGHLGVVGTNTSNTYGYSTNYAIITITYTFTFSFSVNQSTGAIFCNYTITQLGQGPQTGSVNTGRNISMLGNTNGVVSTVTGVGTTSGPNNDPGPFDPIIFSSPFLYIVLPAPPQGYIFFGAYIYMPKAN
jgi:hypothetical protein